MSFEEQQDFARQVADLNKYGQALNRCETVEEVVSLTLEAMSLLFEFSYSTFVEVRDGEPEVVGLSQESETVFYFDIPDAPRESPWSEEHLNIVDEGRELEGVAVVDIDGDVRT
jgi:hypothetical protein